MSKFAKLFERDGRQVLATVGFNDDDEPELTVESTTIKSGHRLRLKIVFGEATDLDQVLEGITEEGAFRAIDESPGSAL